MVVAIFCGHPDNLEDSDESELKNRCSGNNILGSSMSDMLQLVVEIHNTQH